MAEYEGDHYRIRGAYAKRKPLQTPRPPIMLGGSGPALLKLAGEEADILNMIPPTGGRLGRLVLEDAMQFDVGEYRRRSALLRHHACAAGRNPDDIALSQFLFVTPGAERASADALLASSAQMWCLADGARARESPSVLAR